MCDKVACEEYKQCFAPIIPITNSDVFDTKKRQFYYKMS